jgi:uncharacterized protein HemX
MFKAYSGSFIMANGRNRIRTSKRKSSTATTELFPATKLIWKTIGAMLLVTVAIGISSTIWYGMQVQVALAQIGDKRAANNELHIENKLLNAQRGLMLTQVQIETAAKKLGLRPPVKNQLRYPLR